MFKDIIKQEAGIEIYPLISLTVFTIFFVVLIIMTVRYRKSFIEQASMLPLDGEVSENKTTSTAKNQ